MHHSFAEDTEDDAVASNKWKKIYIRNIVMHQIGWDFINITLCSTIISFKTFLISV